MVTKEQVGTRIRGVRTSQRKTLKDVEAASGFSSTHISKIERGRTSPTIGALIRIAHALDKDPSYFIEDRELDEVCVTTSEERPPALSGMDFTGTGMRLDGLTRGILGGRLLVYELILEPLGTAEVKRLPETGDLALYCLSGQCELTANGRAQTFEEGDSFHLAVEDASLAFRSGGEWETRIIIMLDPKESL
jgi:transcriptional regulator with XRE-family HTH domain